MQPWINDGGDTMSDDNEEFRPKSKQQKKREAEAMQALGTTVVELPAAQFKVFIDKTELPEKLQEALQQCRSIKSREAHRRQLQYIGKLMRDMDPEPIQQILAQLKQSGQVATVQLHKIERWRERLLTEGESAFQELLSLYPELDSKHVQKLITAAHRESTQNQAPRSARMLFRYLRDLLQA